MSQAHIEQFYSQAVKNPTLIAAMVAGVSTPEEFVTKAVAAGKEHGFTFTAEEAHTWIKQQQEMKAKGELSDSQLESVAGGKGNSTSTNLMNQSNANNAIVNDPTKSFSQQANAYIVGGFQQIGSWFTSW
jgi:predicted ribosomally synthesized peptide with nif11-like leader